MSRFISIIFLILLLIIILLFGGFYLGGQFVSEAEEVSSISFGEENGGFSVHSGTVVLEGDEFNIDEENYIDPLDQEILDLEYKDEVSEGGGTEEGINFCSHDVDCGDDYYEDSYCLLGDVYRKYHTYTCDEYCTEDVDQELVEECFFGCSEGACVTSFEFECSLDLDCGFNDFIGETFCTEEEGLHQMYINWTCLNPGTEESVCSYYLEEKFVNLCSEGLSCSAGECV